MGGDGSGDVTATANATGGAGGSITNGGPNSVGGAAGTAALYTYNEHSIYAVEGSTSFGSLTLNQNATGGAGGGDYGDLTGTGGRWRRG